MALIFWREKGLRYLFILWSVYMGIVVLLGHLHYSIDVASAYFITYSIFCIAVWLFPKDHKLFFSDVPADVH
jgi:membrane-associated phospholipid phosphatase